MDIPAENTVLGQNLWYLLGLLTEQGAAVRDVLLFIAQPGAPTPDTVNPPSFSLVTLQGPDLQGPGFVEFTTVGAPSSLPAVRPTNAS
jgi:hypothetical protein